MARIESDDGEMIFFTDLDDLSPAERALVEQMCAEMEADRAAEDNARAAS